MYQSNITNNFLKLLAVVIFYVLLFLPGCGIIYPLTQTDCGCRGDFDEDDSESGVGLPFLDDTNGKDDTINSDDSSVDDSGIDDTIFLIDFEDDPVGPLSSDDWYQWFQSGSSSLEIVDYFNSHGKVIKLNGGVENNDSIAVIYKFGPYSGDISIYFDFNRSDIATFSFGVYQGDQSELHTEIQIDTEYLTGNLMVNTGSGYIYCGKLSSGEWQSIAINIRFYKSNYDIMIDNIVSECTEVEMAIGDLSALAGIAIIDQSTSDYGGEVFFDNIFGAIK
jgi:hypothetical protein